jgi:hypothetical protein
MKSENIPKSTKLYGPKGFFGGIFDADIDIGIKAHAPESAKWKEWYEKITIQNLLDHESGFPQTGNNNGPAAAKMFGVSEDQLTYEQGHRYFLRVQGLLHEPGTYAYSNHNFGLWTILIPKMSGKSYLDYVREDFLKPMKLHNAVRPERANPDSCDAWNHKYNADQEPEVFPFEEHGLGLAAGGFRASAQDLARLMVELDKNKNYTTEDLDSMGWGKNSKGKLEHSGLIGGGTAFVAMFPKSYISKDLSEIHVAIAVNLSMKDYDLSVMSVATTNDLVKVGHNLLIVALVGTKLHIRIFEPNGEKAVDKAENELVGGETLTDLKKLVNRYLFESGLTDQEKDKLEANISKYAMKSAAHTQSTLHSLADKIAFAVPVANVPATFDIWKQSKSHCSCEYVRRGVPTNQYQQVVDEAVESGYRLEWIDGYTDDGKVHFNAIFRTNDPAIAWASHHNMTGTTYQQYFDKYRDQGFSLAHIDSYGVGNEVRYAAIWNKSSDAFTAYHGKTSAEHQESFNSLTSKGWTPKVISVASVQGKLFYTALYTKQAIGNFEARSFLTPSEYQTKFDENTAKGRYLHYLNSYVHEGKPRFTAIWAEQPKVSGFKASHGLTGDKFQSSWEDALSADFSTQALTGYEDAGSVRFAAYWTK